MPSHHLASRRGADAFGQYQRRVCLAVGCQVGLACGHYHGGRTESVRKRYEGLGIPDVHLGCAVKIKTYEAFLERYGLRDEEVLYMGDDIPDYEVMQRCGCPCAPADAAPEIKLWQFISPIERRIWMRARRDRTGIEGARIMAEG